MTGISRRVARGAADLATSWTVVRPRVAPMTASAAPRATRQPDPGRPSIVAKILVLPIRAYQRFISPALPPACRFTPTCSQYAVEALRRHGALRGSWLAMRRLARCHPWHPGGEDPVP